MAARVSDAKRPPADLYEFAAAVAHDIRTPLVAVAGEVELALRRSRTAAEYRAALERIAAGVAELVEISGDLTLLSDPIDPTAPSASAQIDTVLSRIHGRYSGRDDVRIAADDRRGVRVAGDEDHLVRAVALVIEHAVRHRRPGASVSVRGESAPAGLIRLVVDAQPAGFWPPAWRSLTGDAAAPLRLRTARRILEAYDGALLVASDSGTDVVHIELHQSS